MSTNRYHVVERCENGIPVSWSVESTDPTLTRYTWYAPTYRKKKDAIEMCDILNEPEPIYTQRVIYP